MISRLAGAGLAAGALVPRYPRGRGLNRRWLPWVAVANVEGILGVEDLGALTAGLVLDAT